MSTAIRNEAADKLRIYLFNMGTDDEPAEWLTAAFRFERRATVERIRERLTYWPKDGAVRDFLAILDEEAAR